MERIRTRTRTLAIASVLVLGLGACLFGGNLTVSVFENIVSISVGGVSIGVCADEEPGSFLCNIAGITSGFATLSLPETFFVFFLLDPLVVQMPDDITGFVGSFSEAGTGTGGDLAITAGLTSVDIDANRTLEAEPGTQLVIIALPPGAPMQGNFAFNVNFEVAPGTTSIDVKPIITGKVELIDGTTYYPPIAPCVTSMANAPTLTIPLDDSTGGNVSVPVTPDLGCDGEVWDLRPRAAAPPIGAFACYQTKPTRGDICRDDSPLNEGALCSSEIDCGGAVGATDFCAPNRFPKGVEATLTDAYEASVVFAAKKPTELCVPATVAGAPSPDVGTYLQGYKSKAARTSPPQAKHVRRTDLGVTNALHPVGEVVLDTIKPRALLLPAAIGPGPVPEPDPATHVVDPFNCYKVRTSKGDPRFPKGIQLLAMDEFNDRRLYDLKKLTRLCAPADKDGQNPGAEMHPDHLLCYKAKLARSQPRQQKPESVLAIFVGDSFGPGLRDTRKLREICLPSRISAP